MSEVQRRFGANYRDGAAEFSVWAPHHENDMIHLVFEDGRRFPMHPLPEGWFEVDAPCQPGDAYQFLV